MEYAFWIGAALLLHTYALYPLSLPLLQGIFGRRRHNAAPIRHRVSLILAAYNEEKVIEEKIRNCFDLEFPREDLEILIGSDGSTDRTDAIVSQYAPAIKLFSFSERSGKSAILNELVPRAQGDIVVFCDANTMLLPNALQKLLAPFDDPDVGCVCGRLILHDSGNSALGIGESIYWNLESEIKKLEGRLGIVIGANGGIYAIRKELYAAIPTDRKVMDDFFTTTRVLIAGKDAVYEPQAIGSEETSLDSYGEFHRKIRISRANFNLLPRYIPLLNPLRPFVAYGFFSHKFLRWIAPLILLFLIAANIALVPVSPWYVGLLGLQGFFYACAALGYLGNGRTRKYKFLLIPFYFVSMNAALLVGLFKSLTSKDTGTWNRVERAPVSAPAPSRIRPPNSSASISSSRSHAQTTEYPN